MIDSCKWCIHNSNCNVKELVEDTLDDRCDYEDVEDYMYGFIEISNDD